MKTIIVPTNFSANAKNATCYAASLAKKMESSIVLLHTFQMPTLTSQTLADKFTEEELTRQHTSKLKPLATELRNEYGIEVKQMACLGELTTVLAQLVKQLNADLVVMGIQDMSMAERLLVGSVTAEVLKYATYPVLVVPFNVSFSPIKHIIFACQYYFLSGHNMLPQLKEIAQAYHAEVEILRIEEPRPELANIRERVETGHYLERIFKGINHSYRFIDNRSVLEGIECEIQESNTDMLVMVPRKHGFWDNLFNRSITRQIVFNTNVPLLALPNPN
jgi:nucleotide-binding universal stress UspA family protein